MKNLNNQILILVNEEKGMKKILKNPSGFTLVELMVVVAIIGILSAIAVPNFKKYQAKSKQSEAKIQLAAVYSAEVGTSADWDTYATCLGLMGYETPPRGYYAIGFQTGFNALTPAPLFTGCDAASTPIVLPSPTHLAAVAANKPSTITHPTSTATQNAFIASAEGSIASGAVNNLDIWQITQTKALTNYQVGY